MEAEKRLVLHVLRGQNLTSLSGLRSHRQGNGEGEAHCVTDPHRALRGRPAGCYRGPVAAE